MLCSDGPAPKKGVASCSLRAEFLQSVGGELEELRGGQRRWRSD